MAAMKQSLPTRIGVVALVSLGLLSATVTTYVLVDKKPAVVQATPTLEPGGGAAVKSYIDTLTTAAQNAGSYAPDSRLIQLLPNHIYTYPGFDLAASPLAGGIVIGAVSEVSAIDPAKPGDPDLALTVTVSKAYGDVAGKTTVIIGSFSKPGQTLAQTRLALKSISEVLIAVDPSEAKNGIEWNVRRRGTLIAQVVDSRIQFLSMSRKANATYVAGAATLGALDTAAARPATIGAVKNGVASP